MPSFKSIVAGLVALLAADAVIAGPCRPSVTTTSVSASSSASTDTETYTVSTGTGNLDNRDHPSFHHYLVRELSERDCFNRNHVDDRDCFHDIDDPIDYGNRHVHRPILDRTSTTSAIASTTTSEAPATLPTIANANFDDNTNGAPWVRSGPASVSNGAVFWKYSAPNVMVMRPETSIAQEITGLRPNLAYRIRFIYVEFDTPSAQGGCKVTASFGGENIGEVPTVPPRTPNYEFEEFVSTVYQPSTTSAELKIGFTCTAPGQSNRYYVENVSIEFAE
ncbi:uncharacterized protein NECHADRAFT_87289 [Fusarium vanettenii 77-13-4]|uniref:CBM-cenC domain-containing protein n=1 Tax=Fusarium vanettenii (strain ATCC MYA-4622 / CBS 123669 / FGSC 9596 / NRRL 45880 / 77-13-4) TaxID=660122 RepID=C7ZIW7_FUSV7|nr:uncharacterized protein NECHADRAFT_87289 [Fusarium vanettenii 77-13-4]EEU36158.1 hypothetical protein NECHADRAFT_87289 [Fusarium vanettenii 77-13-4]